MKTFTDRDEIMDTIENILGDQSVEERACILKAYLVLIIEDQNTPKNIVQQELTFIVNHRVGFLLAEVNK